MLTREVDQEDIRMARKGLERCEQILLADEYEIVILDELTIALYLGLLELADVQKLLHSKRPETELIITGRYAPQELIEMADLVTEMREVKHYYTQGVLSRDGIDR
ncbi:cob(I)alamin adenosyltransferase [Bacteroides reticulotermitis JCM 10512]|uniref:corrinoid adenosyltransferase n=2 Tax=Bacteroides reticulotermitis TaxID=1133319 RepID=W4UXF6_9BACE|nr:cob(I)alamin adenosyltransferase [Bacteroides reticulotermitis JCM 10512]